MASMLSRVELLRTLPPQAFWPAPKVESALVRMTRNDKLGPDGPQFSRFVQKLFSFRRKTLRRALTQMDVDADRIVSGVGVDAQVRPETVMPEVLFAMFGIARAG
jgi:16S rRNA (adenine1518-N6/adenine1519-N6)-dimethyltransferase